MNYFQPFVLGCDDAIVAAWDSQVAELEQEPPVAALVAREKSEVFPRFAVYYARLRALPRGTRRAFERRLARRCARLGAPDWQPRLAGSLAGAALLLAIGIGASPAATINVTLKTPPGINDGDGRCSLAEAIVNANNGGQTFADCEAGSGDDTIVLPKGTQNLTVVDNSDFGDTGLPVITSKITIEGNGAKIVRSKNAPPFRLIAVDASGDLTLDHVTLSGAKVVGKYRGGAITSYGNVTITGSVISGNTGFEGGAVFFENGTLTVTDSTITNNVANYGGGLTNYSGTLIMSNSVMSKNKAIPYNGNPSFGGGLLSTTAHDTITNSVISGNSATKGAGLAVYGTATISNSTISKNSATDKGGGIYNGTGHTLTVTNSTISGNKADTGGGVSNRGAFTLDGGTITKNSAITYGGGVDTSGGGVFTDNGTVTGNKAPVGADTYT
jgi:polymorphic membrane protein